MQRYLQMIISFSRYWANALSEMKRSGIELSRSEQVSADALPLGPERSGT